MKHWALTCLQNWSNIDSLWNLYTIIQWFIELVPIYINRQILNNFHSNINQFRNRIIIDFTIILCRQNFVNATQVDQSDVPRELVFNYVTNCHISSAFIDVRSLTSQKQLQRILNPFLKKIFYILSY